MMTIKTSRKNMHSLPFKLLGEKNIPLEKLFLAPLSPLCYTVSPPPPIWSSRRAYRETLKRTLSCFNNSIKSPVSLLFSRVHGPNFFSLLPQILFYKLLITTVARLQTRLSKFLCPTAVGKLSATDSSMS